MTLPSISVILAAYNAEEYISESIQSILNQTFENFEFLIINNGSTDNTKEIILSYKDKRIKFFENKNNQGLIKTLNKGLYFSQGEYIARMDADDLCIDNRFEKQIAFFKQNKNVDILGSYQYIIGSDRKITHPLVADENKIQLLLQPAVAHSSVLIKKSSLQANNLYYDKHALYAEDYKLWVDACLSKLSIYNIGEYLCGYRIHEKQISNTNTHSQRCISDLIRIGYAKYFFQHILDGNEEEYLFIIHGISPDINKINMQNIKNIVIKLLDENNKNNFFHKILFRNFL